MRLIHHEGCSIAKASKLTGIPYDNAKAINRTYLRERRINKINYRLRYQKKTLAAFINSPDASAGGLGHRGLPGGHRPEIS